MGDIDFDEMQSVWYKDITHVYCYDQDLHDLSEELQEKG